MSHCDHERTGEWCKNNKGEVKAIADTRQIGKATLYFVFAFGYGYDSMCAFRSKECCSCLCICGT